MRKPYHYWAIHKREFKKAWENLAEHERRVIASDVEGKSRSLPEFAALLTAKTEANFQDPNYYSNQKDTFRFSN